MTDGNVLRVTSLGGFRAEYNNIPLDCLRTGSSQFVSLLQLVAHYPDGARPQDLQDALFGGRRNMIEDMAHAVRSVVYNANLKLDKAGLPGHPHIVQKKGVCCWSGKVPIQEDARAFEVLCEKALRSGDLELLEQACYQYSGGFLNGYSNAVWIVAEARRYRDAFSKCAEAAREKLESAGAYDRLHALAVHAAAACPFSGWEQVSVRALNAMGRHSEAMELHEAASRKYFQEQGVKLAPWQSLPDVEKSDWHWAGTPLGEIKKALGETEHAPLVCYMTFRDTYKILSELSWRTGMSLYLMSCTVYDRKGGLLADGPVRDRVVDKLGAAVSKAIRTSDAACHCGGGCFLILLPDIVLEDCALVQKRICDIFYEKGRSMTLKFDAISVPDARKGVIGA